MVTSENLGGARDEVGEIIRSELWPNPYTFFAGQVRVLCFAFAPPGFLTHPLVPVLDTPPVLYVGITPGSISSSNPSPPPAVDMLHVCFVTVLSARA